MESSNPIYRETPNLPSTETTNQIPYNNNNNQSAKKVALVALAIFVLGAGALIISATALPMAAVVTIAVGSLAISIGLLAAATLFKSKATTLAKNEAEKKDPTTLPKFDEVEVTKETSEIHQEDPLDRTYILKYESKCDWAEKPKVIIQYEAALKIFVEDSVMIHTELLNDLEDNDFYPIIEPVNTLKDIEIIQDSNSTGLGFNNCRLNLCDKKFDEEKYEMININGNTFLKEKKSTYKTREAHDIEHLIARNNTVINAEFIKTLSNLNYYSSLQPLGKNAGPITFNQIDEGGKIIIGDGMLRCKKDTESSKYFQASDVEIYAGIPQVLVFKDQDSYKGTKGESISADNKIIQRNLSRYQTIIKDNPTPNSFIPLELKTLRPITDPIT